MGKTWKNKTSRDQFSKNIDCGCRELGGAFNSLLKNANYLSNEESAWVQRVYRAWQGGRKPFHDQREAAAELWREVQGRMHGAAVTESAGFAG